MSEHRPTACEQFIAHAEELALGQVDEPQRGQLLAHAADCPHCHSLLDGLGTVVDSLLLAAPQVEPSAGFESRALARLDAGGATAARRSSALRRLAVAAIAVAGVLVVAGTFEVFRRNDGSSADAAAIVAAGTEVGSVQLIAEPTPHVLVVIDTPRPGPGRRICELQRTDGSWTVVGSWDAAEIASGVWAVGIDPALLDSTAMRITSDGDVLATADFD